MLTDDELVDLMMDIESDRVERKESGGDKDKIGQAICAFANDLPYHGKPGVLFVGLRDDGSCAASPITDQLLQNLAGYRSDGNILPFPILVVQKKCINGCEVAVVIVQPSPSPPVRYKQNCWVRVGPRRARATRDEERILSERRRSKDVPFDQQPVAGATLDDLDLLIFRREYLPAAVSPEIIEENHRTDAEQLAALRFLDHYGVPTVAAILTLGKAPRQWIPGGYIQFARFTGPSITDPVRDQKEIDGSLYDQLRQLDEIFSINVSIAADMSGSVEIQKPDYPLRALRELTRNAILHRNYETSNTPTRVYWYEDRIEIISPGGPFGRVNAANFGQPGITDYRNPTLAETLKALGYVQRFGMGIEVARKELAKNGNPPPEFAIDQSNSGVVAIMRRAS